MADEANNTEEQQPKKGSKKPLLILLALLVVEAAVIAGLFMIMGKPADVNADGAVEDETALAEQPVEELVVEAKFPNTKRGRTFIYDMEVYIVIRRKNQERIQGQLEEMAAQISGDVRAIIGLAEPNHLLEPTLATIKRQIKAALDERLGRNEDGASYVDQVVITKFTQFRADL